MPEGELYSLADGDIICIYQGQINGVMQWTPHVLDTNTSSSEKYQYNMLKEIYETPQAIENTYRELINVDVAHIFHDFKKLTLLACGTAFNSCLIGAMILNKYTNKQATSMLASEYSIESIDQDHLHIIVSQSGETADCIKVTRHIKSLGGKILVITNEPTSTIVQYADYRIITRAHKEFAVASTKTYCCQLFVFAYIVNNIRGNARTIDILSLTQQLKDYIATIDIHDYAKMLEGCQHLILIGKGVDYLTIIEASLKIREIDYVYTIPIFASELKHGTLSLIDDSSFVLSLSSTLENDITTTKNEIKSRKGNVIEFDHFISNVNVDDIYLPIFTIIPFQLLSYQIAVLNDRNPDMPRNLAKSVTVE